MRPIINKDPRILLPKLLAGANGAPCFLAVPGVCNYDSDTTVPCHSNYYKHGKSKGKKAHDIFMTYGCSDCHSWLDGQLPPGVTEAERMDAFEAANIETLKYAIREGFLK